jgi:hypothetical protein
MVFITDKSGTGRKREKHEAGSGAGSGAGRRSGEQEEGVEKWRSGERGE